MFKNLTKKYNIKILPKKGLKKASSAPLHERFPSASDNIPAPMKSFEKKGWLTWFKDKFFGEKEQPKKYNLGLIKIKESERNNNSTSRSYWGQALVALAALVTGGTIAQMQEEQGHDILNQERFKDLREFINFVEDAELKKRWNLCQKKPKCNEAICDAIFITLIDWDSNPYNIVTPYMAVKGYQFDRVINAKIAEQVIKKHYLDLIGIPKKTILFDGNSWKVVTEKVDVDEIRKLSLEQTKQLTTFILETGFQDFLNILIDKNGKLFFIDTEDSSFSRDKESWNKYERLSKFISLFNHQRIFNQETIKWLEEYKKQFDNSQGRKEILPLYRDPVINQSFEGFNLEKIRIEAKEYQKIFDIEFLGSGKVWVTRINIEDEEESLILRRGFDV